MQARIWTRRIPKRRDFFEWYRTRNPSAPIMTDRHKIISVVLADDHPAILLGVAELLRSNPDIKVAATCSDGTAVMQAIRQIKPTVAVLDFFMPGLNGLEVLASMSAERSATKAVFLTATATDKQLLTAVSRGAKGVVLKEMA